MVENSTLGSGSGTSYSRATRLICFLCFVIVGVVGSVSVAKSAELGEDGLHKKEWFVLTFKDVREDILEAKNAGKRLALIFEQRGCIYCSKLHETLLQDPDVVAYLTEHYHIVQYNLFGDEEVTDVDGDTLSEKEAAFKWGVMFTPFVLFMPDEAPQMDSGLSTKDIAVATMPGVFGKMTFMNLFKWVYEKGYDGPEHFQKYHARVIEELRAGGKLSQ